MQSEITREGLWKQVAQMAREVRQYNNENLQSRAFIPPGHVTLITGDNIFCTDMKTKTTCTRGGRFQWLSNNKGDLMQNNAR